MTEFNSFPPNTFCWPELTTTDATAAKKFYAGLFGWSLRDDQAGPAVYTMASLNDKLVGAMFQRTPEQEQMGVPSNWLSYVSVTDVKTTFDKAVALGASALMGPMDVMDVGKMAVLADPQGAVFALWQPLKHGGAQLANVHGSFTWNELYTKNVDGSGAFYTKLFDWKAELGNFDGVNYTSFMNGEKGAGGMIEIAPEWGEVPPHWLVYFAVDDCDAIVKKTKSLGGNILKPPMDIAEVGRFAVVADPTGGAFGVIKLANPPA